MYSHINIGKFIRIANFNQPCICSVNYMKNLCFVLNHIVKSLSKLVFKIFNTQISIQK